MRIALFLTLCILSVSEASAGIIVNFIDVAAGVYSREYNSFVQNGDTYAGEDVGIPVSSGVSDLNFPDIANTSRVAFNVQQDGQNATVEFAWDHRIVGVTNDEAYGFASVDFTPTIDMRYELSGAYSVLGTAASFQYSELGGYIDSLDIYSLKESRSTPNETLVVGSLLGGDYHNNVVGSFTGELKAGQQYFLFGIWYIHSYSDSAPSTGAGTLHLSLSPTTAAAVPEPSSLVLLGIGICAVSLRQRKAFHRKSTAAFLPPC